MDRRQRLDDPTTSVAMAVNAALAGTRTAGPGIIQSFDPVAMTCTVQPAIQGTQVDPKTGDVAYPNLPLLEDCPVQFAGGGGCTLTFPLGKGDECLVVIADRCIDAWWQNGGTQQAMSLRQHDLSDGFVIPGIRSQPRVLPNISTDTAQLRSDDGSTYIELDAAGKEVNVVAPAGITFTTPSAAFSGNLLAGTGASGTFTSKDGLTITVQDGIITNIY